MTKYNCQWRRKLRRTVLHCVVRVRLVVGRPLADEADAARVAAVLD